MRVGSSAGTGSSTVTSHVSKPESEKGVQPGVRIVPGDDAESRSVEAWSGSGTLSVESTLFVSNFSHEFGEFGSVSGSSGGRRRRRFHYSTDFLHLRFDSLLPLRQLSLFAFNATIPSSSSFHHRTVVWDKQESRRTY